MQLLLPYALDTFGKLIHIDDAHKSEKYRCPTCNAELVLKIGKIPEGQKYHRRNHFAHKCNSDNHCSESYLHKRFKDECAKLILEKISQEVELNFEWTCQICQKKHNYNLLSNVTEVITEYNLKECRPDIALVDNNKNIIFVIEVCVKHFPESKVLQYYSDNNISCLVTVITDFADCDNIEEKLTHPSRYFLNPKPFCDGCDKMINRKIPKKTSNNTITNMDVRPIPSLVIPFNTNNEISTIKTKTYTSRSLRSQDLATPQLSSSNSNARFIKLLNAKGNKICPICRATLQIKERWDGTPFLQCINAPKCEYVQSVDSVIWPERF